MVSPGGSWQDVRPRLVLLLAASGCNRAADQGVDPLTRKGIPQLADACVRGSGGSCRIVGDKYLKGSGVPKDVNAAIAYYTRGCFTDPDSCVALGVLRLEGREVPKNESEALALFRNACSRGSWNGCSDLGMMYQKGQGGVADPAFGADLFRKGCEREDPLYRTITSCRARSQMMVPSGNDSSLPAQSRGAGTRNIDWKGQP